MFSLWVCHHVVLVTLVCLRADLDGTIFPYYCSMQPAHVTSTTRIVSSKSDVQHLHDSCTQHENCRRILKHVLKPCDSHSHNKMLEWRVVYDFCLTRAVHATKRQQKSHRINRPLVNLRQRAISAGASATARFNHATLVQQERPDKDHHVVRFCPYVLTPWNPITEAPTSSHQQTIPWREKTKTLNHYRPIEMWLPETQSSRKSCTQKWDMWQVLWWHGQACWFAKRLGPRPFDVP